VKRKLKYNFLILDKQAGIISLSLYLKGMVPCYQLKHPDRNQMQGPMSCGNFQPTIQDHKIRGYYPDKTIKTIRAKEDMTVSNGTDISIAK